MSSLATWNGHLAVDNLEPRRYLEKGGILICSRDNVDILLDVFSVDRITGLRHNGQTEVSRVPHFGGLSNRQSIAKSCP